MRLCRRSQLSLILFLSCRKHSSHSLPFIQQCSLVTNCAITCVQFSFRHRIISTLWPHKFWSHLTWMQPNAIIISSSIWIRNGVVFARKRNEIELKNTNEKVILPVSENSWKVKILLHILLAMMMMVMHSNVGQFNTHPHLHIFTETFGVIYIAFFALNRFNLKNIWMASF